MQRYSTINAELQSLRDVIDMRNAEIKKLKTKMKDLEIKVRSVIDIALCKQITFVKAVVVG